MANLLLHTVIISIITIIKDNSQIVSQLIVIACSFKFKLFTASQEQPSLEVGLAGKGHELVP